MRSSIAQPFSQAFWYGTAGFALFLVLWSGVAVEEGGIGRIPTASQTWGAWSQMLLHGELGPAIIASTSRILVGAFFASLMGIMIGSLAGLSKTIDLTLTPLHAFFRYIPPTSFIPVLIFFLGIGETFQYAVVFISIYFFIYRMTLDAYRDIDQRYLDMARIDGLDAQTRFRGIILPAIGPRLLDLVRLNVTAAWTFLVASEMIGATEGLGRLIVTAQRFGKVDEMFAVLLTFGIIGLLLDALFALARKVIFPWIKRE